MKSIKFQTFDLEPKELVHGSPNRLHELNMWLYNHSRHIPVMDWTRNQDSNFWLLIGTLNCKGWHTGSAHRLDQVNNCLNFCENQLSCLGDMEPTANLIFKHMIDLELEGLWHRFGTLSQMLFEANYKEIECNIFRYKSTKTIDILVRN